MALGQTFWVPGDTPAQMLAAGYGDLKWTPQGNISSAWTGTVSVLVTGQDLSSVTVSFTLSTVGNYATSTATANATLNGTTTLVVNSVSAGTLGYGTTLTDGAGDLPNFEWITGQVSGTPGGAGTYTLAYAATGSTTESVSGSLKSGILVIDATCSGCDTTGAGTIASPWQTLNKVYGTTEAGTDNPGAMLYLRGNNTSTDYEAYDQSASAGITVGGKENPIAIMGYPGDPTPDIDITNLSGTISAKGDVFFNWDDASDLFVQGLTFTGTPSCACQANFTYLEEPGYGNNRLTYDNLSAPSVFPGTSTASGNSTFIGAGLTASPFNSRSYITIKGVSETGRPGNFLGDGIYNMYASQYGVAEFDNFQGSGAGAGAAYHRKLTVSNWTNRYDFASGGVFNMLQSGYEASSGTPNTNIEDAYNTIVFTTANPTSPGLMYNDSLDAFTTNVYSYRNSVIGAAGVAQNGTTDPIGPFTFMLNAYQYGTGLSQGLIFSTDGHTWSGGAFPSNVTDTTPAVCNAASGVFDGSNNLEGSCKSTWLGQVGAQIQ